MNHILFYITWIIWHVAYMARRQAGGSSDGVLKLCCRPCTPFSWKLSSLIAVASFSKLMYPSTKKEMFQEWYEEHNQFTIFTWPSNSPIQSSFCGMCWTNKSKTMEAPPHNLQNFKDLLLTYWCQIPQHTFRGQVESISRQVRDVLMVKREPTQVRWS